MAGFEDALLGRTSELGLVLGRENLQGPRDTRGKCEVRSCDDWAQSLNPRTGRSSIAKGG